MNSSLLLGFVLLIGVIGGKIASKAKLPSVTGYIIFGLLVGPSFLNIITREAIYAFQPVNQLALGILSLSIGSELHYAVFRKYGKNLFKLFLGEGLLTFSLVASFTYLFGMRLQFAILLGILALTVSPSGVLSIVKETGSKGLFTQNLLALVAVDNLFAILSFGVVSALLQGVGNSDTAGATLFLGVVQEVLLTLGIGMLLGIILTYLIKKRPATAKFTVILLGFVFLGTGLADHFQLSALLLNMTMGATITNLTLRRNIVATSLERIELPVFVSFLTLAGAKLDTSVLVTSGLVGVGYISGRLVGKIVGSYSGAMFTDLTVKMRKNLGLALTPQAGVAIGLSVIAEQKFPESNGMLTGIVLSGVIFFEVVGPLLLKKALDNVGETRF
ncbi:cation:proton antiporter [Alkalicella caledoniensis]|uniref:Cation:proton antiporter n=1 Tax=Alkalicella caledoniensis TaxID=2731377 RepID=A0A7G9W562_ALKCA|nr:cation:proton antiporter [Alkalicella caledoniensis]QNO13824.1 cation:proton antiporter [Alkalicella caledoniensis]